MSFKDEVNSRLRTPEQIWVENAKSDYAGIKSQILSMAHAGKFVNVAGKRMIEIDYQGVVKNLFKHDYVIKGIKGNLFSPGGGYTSSAFILQNHSAYNDGYMTICDIGKARIVKAGDGISTENGKNDIGFRVLKMDSSNMKDVYYNPSQVGQQSLFDMTDNIKEDRTPEDLLFQVMLDLGVLLSSKIEEKIIAGVVLY